MSISNTTALTGPSSSRPYPVNIRLTIPFLPRSFFITIVAGPERRTPERRREERRRHPLATTGNLATFVGGWVLLLIAAAVAAVIIARL